MLDDHKPDLSEKDILDLYNLLVKIEQWWFLEIEVTTNPEMDDIPLEALKATELPYIGLLRYIIKNALPNIKLE